MDRTTAPGHLNNLFVEGSPFEDVPAAVVSSAWLNGVQEELVGLIESAGIVPNSAATNQVLAAFQTLFGNSPGVFAAAAASPLESAGPIADSRQPFVLVAQSGLWTAGVTTEAPTQGTGSGGDGPGAADNTDDANEYDTGLYPGDSWPFTVPGAQMAHDTAGSFPAAVSGSNVNFYRHGFFLPRGIFTSGAQLDILIAGTYFSTESRIVEIIVEPEFAPDAAFDTTKAFAFQTGTILTTASAEVGFEAIILLEVLGFDASTSEWIVVGTIDYKIGNDPTAALLSGGRRTIVKRIAVADADFELLDTLWNVRVKTDDPGATLGDTGNSSGSAQDGASGVLEMRSFRVTLNPGGH